MIMGKHSNLPSSISITKTILDRFEKEAKFSVGPIFSKPGPTLFIQAITDVNEVEKSKLFKDIKSNDIKNSPRYIIKYTWTPCTVDISKSLSSLVTIFIDLGFKVCLMDFLALLNIITNLCTLRPPPVEPAQAPINIKIIRIVCENIDH